VEFRRVVEVDLSWFVRLSELFVKFLETPCAENILITFFTHYSCTLLLTDSTALVVVLERSSSIQIQIMMRTYDIFLFGAFIDRDSRFII